MHMLCLFALLMICGMATVAQAYDQLAGLRRQSGERGSSGGTSSYLPL